MLHGVVGRDEREGNSPSWFNQQEAKLVMQYVNDLLEMRANRPSPQDIGIISPYRKQVQKIRALLRGKYGNGIKVGSVEEFQGQERRVIIISTVRSSAEHLAFDAKFRLGFLSNPKRFNVAITRPKELLVVVGNPEVLKHDNCWLEWMRHVHLNGGCTGVPMPPEVTEAEVAPAGPSCAPETPAGDMWGQLAGMLDRMTIGTAPRAPAAVPHSALVSSYLMPLGGQLAVPAPDAGGSAATLEDEWIGVTQAEGGEMPRLE
mmetsp:Transcript_6441/g.11006  ORF Transcript_6441/g.11006 Transcript_6441/m.11006 type:complete len:260 (-) Transcript_6441:528-1307(-)